MTNPPLLFLGIAEELHNANAPFPMGSIDLFHISRHKSHFVFPAYISHYHWIFLISAHQLLQEESFTAHIKICNNKQQELAKGTIQLSLGTEHDVPSISPSVQSQSEANDKIRGYILPAESLERELLISPLKFGTFIATEPGTLTIMAGKDEASDIIGHVTLHHSPPGPVLPEHIRAAASNPDSHKLYKMVVGCKLCNDSIECYTAFERDPSLEKKGCIFQNDLPDRFACSCGNIDYSLQYMRSSLHGFLIRDATGLDNNISYVRRYAHGQIEKTINEYLDLVLGDADESDVQKFIENNPLLLSMFSAQKLYFQPSLLGKFKPDFAVLSTSNHLWLIEIESPQMQLFRKDGHPTADLHHAYRQVADWLNEYRRFPQAFLDALKLTESEIVSVRGAVIAGRNATIDRRVLQNFYHTQPYPSIEFLTLDELGYRTLQISKKLA